MTDNEFFGTARISRILMKLAPPVMLAQLIQALYNIVDSFFIGRCSEAGLTALSIIYPLQLLMIALAVGTGVGINTAMAYFLGIHDRKRADEIAGASTPLALGMWALFAAVTCLMMPAYARMSTPSEEVIRQVVTYGRITCVCSIGLFLESGWTKVLQAEGNMTRPMTAQILGAVVNIVLDPLLIFGLAGLPELGIAGAAIATVSGQIVAALMVFRGGFRPSPARQLYPALMRRIYRLGVPNILMQSAYTFYILGLNLILKTFSDQAVTTLGLYYKWQTFFFIPLGAMQTCIVPVISYNYAAGNLRRCHKTLMESTVFGMALMSTGTLFFELIPGPMLRVFSQDPEVLRIGVYAFRCIGPSFLPIVTAQIFPVFFQAAGYALKSSFLTILRTVILFVPLGWLLARLGGLEAFWMVFPITEILTTLGGVLCYRQFLQQETARSHPSD